MLSSYKKDIVAILLLALILPIFYLRLFVPKAQVIVTPDFARSDSWHFNQPTRYFLQQAIKKHELPMWSAKIGGGYPLLGEGQTGIFFIPNLIIFYIFDFPTAYNMSIVLAVWCFGMGMYVWLRLQKISIIAAFSGCLFLGNSGIVIAQLTHISLLQGLSLLPLLLIATYILYHRKNLISIVLFAIVGSQQLLAGFPQSALYSLIFAGVYYLWLCRQSLSQIGNFARFAAVVLFILGLSAIQLVPSNEYLSQTTVSQGLALVDAMRYSFPLKHLLTFIDPFLLGNPHNGTYPELYKFDESIFWENSGYIGIIPLLFAGLTLIKLKSFSSKNKALAVFMIVVGALSLLLMLGKHSPIYLIYSFWPLNLFRVPSRAIWMLVFSLVTLATLGIHHFLQKGGSAKKMLVVVLIIINTAVVMGRWWDYHLLGNSQSWFTKPEIIQDLDPKQKIFTLNSEKSYSELFYQKWEGRTYQFANNFLAPNTNIFWGITSHNSYAGRQLRRSFYIDQLIQKSTAYTDDNRLLIDKFGKKLLDLQSANVIISAAVVDDKSLSLGKTSKLNDAQIRQYINPQAVPRFYFATQPVSVGALENVTDTLKDDSFVVGTSVLVEENISLNRTPDASSDATVEMISESDTRVKLKTKYFGGEAILVSTDSYFPGWQASIDTKPVKIYPANLRQRAIVVPEGEHTIEYLYEPKSLRLGFYITLATASLMSILVVLSKVAWLSTSRLYRFVLLRLSYSG